MQARLVSSNPIAFGLGLALVLWFCLQFTGLLIASNAFEGPEDPEYYRNGLKYAQVLAAGKPVARVEFTLPAGPKAGQTLTVGVKGATSVTFGRPATLREDRTLPVNDGQVSVRLPRGWWVVRSGENRARFWVDP